MAFLNYCATTVLLIFGAQSLGYLSSAFSSNHVIGLALGTHGLSWSHRAAYTHGGSTKRVCVLVS